MHENLFSSYLPFLAIIWFSLISGLNPAMSQIPNQGGEEEPMCDSIRLENLFLREKVERLQQRIDSLSKKLTPPSPPLSYYPYPPTEKMATPLPNPPNGGLPLPGNNNIRIKTLQQLNLEIGAALKKYPTTLAKTYTIFGQRFDTFIIDLHESKKLSIKFYWKDNEGKKYFRFDKIQQANPENFIFATNGGMYTPQFDPQGLLVQEGTVQHSLEKRKNGYGNFYMQPNGVFLVDSLGKPHIVRTQDYHLLHSTAWYATQSGPMLVHNGQINANFTRGSQNLRLRSGVGIIDDNRIVFVISKERVNFHAFARIFKEAFNCRDALFLDGEVSKFYCPELKLDNPLIGNYGTIIGVYKE